MFRDLDLPDTYAEDFSDSVHKDQFPQPEVALGSEFEGEEVELAPVEEGITVAFDIAIPEERGAETEKEWDAREGMVLHVGVFIVDRETPDPTLDDTRSPQDGEEVSDGLQSEDPSDSGPPVADDAGQKPPIDCGPEAGAAEIPEEEPERRPGLPDDQREYAIRKLESHGLGEARVEELAEAFEPYRAQMEQIDAQLTAGIDPADIPGYITSGGTNHVFETPDGKILKLPRIVEGGETTQVMFEYIAPLALGQGYEGLEQVVAAVEDTENTKAGIVCEPAPGNRLTEYDYHQLQALPIEHFEGLMETVIAMCDQGLEPDFHHDNAFHSPVHRITIIDYDLSLSEHLDPAVVAAEFERVMWDQLDEDSEPLPLKETNFYHAYKNVFGEASLPVLERVVRELDGSLRTVRRLMKGDDDF
jgi:hypothetical protein